MADAPLAWEPGARANLRYDVPAGLVVSLVALPLCLGIALASNAPLVAGLVAGVVGGLVVAPLSGSAIAVSGPAAGLAVIVAAGIQRIGSFEGFLAAVVLSGAMQVALGLLRLGFVVNFVPQCVIKGMLAAIGIIIVLKQIPHALGRDQDYLGDEGFLQADHENTLSEIVVAVLNATPGPVIVALVSVAVLLLWERPALKTRAWSRWVPGGLVVVTMGVLLNALFGRVMPALAITEAAGHLVSLPPFDGPRGLLGALAFPDPAAFGHPEVWSIALTIALVGSIETLLSVEATDKLDPFRRPSPKNRELLAQGLGNIVSGFLGGLPITAVIVRSSANVYAGGRTRTSAIVHGVLLLGAVLLVPTFLNRIPLASLAAILFFVGYKLAKVGLFREMFRAGAHQWLPFVVTVVAIVFSDLLTGVMVGVVVGVGVILATDTYSAITMVHDGVDYLVRFRKDVSFWHKARLHDLLARIPDGAHVVIDAGRAMFVDHDIVEVVDDFRASAVPRRIAVDVLRLDGKEFRFHRRSPPGEEP